MRYVAHNNTSTLLMRPCVRRDMPVDEAVELGRRAIYHATFRDCASGGTVSGEWTKHERLECVLYSGLDDAFRGARGCNTTLEQGGLAQLGCGNQGSLCPYVQCMEIKCPCMKSRAWLGHVPALLPGFALILFV